VGSHSKYNFKSFHEDYYRLHRKWCSVSTSPDCQTLHTRSSHRINKRWTFIFHPWHPIFHKVSASGILYKAQLNAIIVNRKYTLLGRLVNLISFLTKLQLMLKTWNVPGSTQFVDHIKMLQLKSEVSIGQLLHYTEQNVHSLWKHRWKCTNFLKRRTKT
jgi:uncharacterized metal-binding protein